jgi:CubicO group peptidase (beta-lactamase class C family)
MATLWDALKTLTGGAPSGDAGRSARMGEHIESLIGDGDPGLALAVVRSGVTVHLAGYGLADAETPVTPDTIFHLASAGKQITGIGILMLVEEGKLRLDDPVARYIPELSGFGPNVTLRHCLHHTSGIRDLYDDYGAEQVLVRCKRPSNNDVIRTYVELNCPMSTFGCEPGDSFAYTDSGYNLLASVIERVSGQSYRDYFQIRVFDRLGMKDTFTFPDSRLNDGRIATGYELDDNNHFVACEGTPFDDLTGGGSFYTTVHDLCIYDRALATNALVRPASMREALRSGYTNDGKPTNYGFGWFVGVYEGMQFSDHQGQWIGHYSYICRYLDHPLSMFLMSNNPTVNLVEVANVATEIFR